MKIKHSRIFNWLNTLSIRHKIQYSIISFAFAVLVITAITLSMSANSHFHRSIQRELTVLAQVLAENSRVALTFSDAEAAVNILSAVQKNSDIVSATIYQNDAVFAVYPANSNVPDIKSLTLKSGVSFEQGTYTAIAAIAVAGKNLGWLRLQSKFDVWQLVWKRFIVTFAGLLLAVGLLTFFMSYWLKKHITMPLRGLSEWSRNVYQNKDFTARANKQSNDEIGQLADSLNAMLTELSKQESIISLNHNLEQEITVRKETEKALIAMRDKAEKASRSKGDFLANMSHEIRTPMNAIIGFVDIVLEGNLDDTQKEHLHTVRNSAKDLHNLLNEILDVAKLEEGKLVLEQAPFSVQDLVHHVIKTFEMGASKKGIQLIQRISPNLAKQFLGDAMRLKQILMNLLGNALKFTDSGSITVAVEQVETGKLQFIVRDTGIGIVKDKIKHIFESFSQADSSTSRKYGGTGLGTTISKRLVELMDGKIWLESDLGVGSTFYFTVCVGSTDELVSMEHLYIDPALLKTDKSLQILVAEDGEQNAELLRIRLEGLGHRITRAVNGLEAVNLFPSQAFDIILMDIQMPIMDGLQAATEIRALANGGEIPIIALTASVMHEDRMACFAAGMDGFVKKPIVFNELFTEMAKLLLNHFNSTENITSNDSVTRVDSEIPYLDFQHGIEMWGGEDVFVENLKQFAQRHQSDVLQIQTVINQMDFDEGLRLVHALKGTTGNLALIELHDELQIMHGYFKRKNMTAAQEHFAILAHTFNATMTSIASLSPPTSVEDIASTLSTQEAIEHIKLLNSLYQRGELNESIACILLKQLPVLNIPKEVVSQLRHAVNDFDFEQAISVLTEIEVLLEKGVHNDFN